MITYTTARSGLRLPRLLTALLALLAVTAGACAGTAAEPEERLAAAAENTFDGSFAYELSVDADPAALEALGEGAADTAGLLAGFGLRGVKDAESLSLAVELTAGSPLLELRSFGEEAFYLHLGINDLLGLTGAFDPRGELAPALDALGFGPEAKTAVLDLLDGKWVGVEGELDIERIRTLLGAERGELSDEELDAAASELLGDDLGEFFQRYVTVLEATETEDGEIHDVRFELREFLRATSTLSERAGGDVEVPDELEAELRGLPETVPGTVTVADEHVVQIRLELSGENAEGSVVVVLDITELGDVEPIVRPEGATVLTDEQFTEAVAKVVGLTGGL